MSPLLRVLQLLAQAAQGKAFRTWSRVAGARQLLGRRILYLCHSVQGSAVRKWREAAAAAAAGLPRLLYAGQLSRWRSAVKGFAHGRAGQHTAIWRTRWCAWAGAGEATAFWVWQARKDRLKTDFPRCRRPDDALHLQRLFTWRK